MVEEEDGLGAMLGAGFEDVSLENETLSKQARREERLRKAFARSRETYQAKVEEEGWFFANGVQDAPYEVWNAPNLDTKTMQRLESCMVYLYAKKRYHAAYEWACALLTRACVLQNYTHVPWGPTDLPPTYPSVKRTKLEKSLSTSSIAREALDVALRCMLHTQPADSSWTWDDASQCIVAAAFDRIRIDQREYDALIHGGLVQDQAAKQCLARWARYVYAAVIPEVRQRTDPGAVEAFALVLGVRGTQWRILAFTSQALSQLALATNEDAFTAMAQASLACALQACTFTNRVTLATDALAGRILMHGHIPKLTAERASEASSDADHDAALLRHLVETHALSSEASVGLLWMALRKRGGATLLANRLPSYLQTAREMLQGNDTAWFAYDDDTDTTGFRSVHSL